MLTLINDVSFLDSTLIGLVLLFLAYLTGDLMVLPKMGNIAATIGDFVLSLIIVWGGMKMLGYNDAFGEAFAASIVVAAGEYFYHKWLAKNQLHHTDTNHLV
ncbi:DUF2512 family protein [Neobacillus terrae]|uniref:DUF2512 family protein n=1 Tax=Neobacillus terrae TaxID=3034837 RepID=UPI003082B53A